MSEIRKAGKPGRCAGGHKVAVGEAYEVLPKSRWTDRCGRCAAAIEWAKYEVVFQDVGRARANWTAYADELSTAWFLREIRARKVLASKLVEVEESPGPVPPGVVMAGMIYAGDRPVGSWYAREATP